MFFSLRLPDSLSQIISKCGRKLIASWFVAAILLLWFCGWWHFSCVCSCGSADGETSFSTSLSFPDCETLLHLKHLIISTSAPFLCLHFVVQVMGCPFGEMLLAQYMAYLQHQTAKGPKSFHCLSNWTLILLLWFSSPGYCHWASSKNCPGS